MSEYTASYLKNPNLNLYYNKLWLYEKLNYLCGISKETVPLGEHVVVKPIYNFYGRGIGCSLNIKQINSPVEIPPGYFWSIRYKGYTQFKADFTWCEKSQRYEMEWLYKITPIIKKNDHNRINWDMFGKFSRYEKFDTPSYQSVDENDNNIYILDKYSILPPSMIEDFAREKLEKFNVEFLVSRKGDTASIKILDVHLTHSSIPRKDVLIPKYNYYPLDEDDIKNSNWITAFDEDTKNLEGENYLLGYYWR